MRNLLYGPDDSKRFVQEAGSDETWRDEYRRDFARVIHCPSFRRLQGKTQLFPGHESDFFRNRLTHSLEVGQIAESIACKVNATQPFFSNNPINPRLCLTAALLHDIGHPPFGHNGEEALDEKMREHGGFEGNAQTLRIVSQLEKKRFTDQTCPLQRRAGLNLTYRTLGAVLKYDQVIKSIRGKSDRVSKGYYLEDAPVVADIKSAVAPGYDGKSFKTIECSIMDIADDIAYSTYDLEDSFKAGFLKPSKILTMDFSVLHKVAEKVRKEVGIEKFSAAEVLGVFLDIFENHFEAPQDMSPATPDSKVEKILTSLQIMTELDNIATDSYIRTQFTSDLVGKFISGVSIEENHTFPQLSKIKVEKNTLIKIETLKNLSFEATIFSNRVKVSEYRGKEIVGGIFDALSEKKGHLLLPEDTLSLFSAAREDRQKQLRVICDFIAGMTDRYAIEFYSRLYSDSAQSMFKPV